jgi:hypothetical protein
VLLSLEIPFYPRKATKVLPFVPLFLLLCSTAGVSQGHKKDEGSLPSMTPVQKRKSREWWTK